MTCLRVERALGGGPLVAEGENPPAELQAESLARLQVKVAEAAGVPRPPAGRGLKAELFQAFADLAGDPDTDLVPWLREGAL